MERDPQQLLGYMVEVEGLAEEVIADRQQIIELDRRRNQTRTAIRAVQKDKETDKNWVCFGDMFLKLPKHQTKKLLENDFDRINDELNDVQKNLKGKVTKLRDMEHKEELKGFHLKPLSSEELRSLGDVL